VGSGAACSRLSKPWCTRRATPSRHRAIIAREPCAGDGRGLEAVLTARGRRRLLEAHPTHVRSIRERFAGHLADDELATLAELLGRLTAR